MSTTVDVIDGTAPEATLRVFKFGGVNWVVAYGLEDAWAVWCEHTGEDREDYDAVGHVEEVDDSAIISIRDDDQISMKLTARQWADREGRGFLCSTEF